MELTSMIQPPFEWCTDTALPEGFIDPPVGLIVQARESPLVPPLREAAGTRDAYEILARAAAVFYRAEYPPAGLSRKKEDLRLGTALADLAVTGRAAFTNFQQRMPLNESDIAARTSSLITYRVADPADVAHAVSLALDRAYDVAWALRGSARQRAAERPPLGWIAVSGQDDMPHRPVNVPAPPFEQYEIPVTVPGRAPFPSVTVKTRFFIASPHGGPVGAITHSNRELPPDPQPQIPDGNNVILFLHGHSSGAEEALTIIPHIHMAGLKENKKFSIIAVDLPNNGYSESFAHTVVAPSEATSFPGGILEHGPVLTPVLDFIEDFIVAFVDALDQITPIKNRFSGVIGGSLGGNLGLRLGRRSLVSSPWLNAGIVSWSAASVWDPMIQDELKRHAPEHCRDMWGVAEVPASRGDYFYDVFEKTAVDIIVPYTQPEMWYRDGWECRTLHIKVSRLARREIYNENFRQWHWRVAGEQLIYSHVDRVNHEDDSTPYRYQLNTVPQLLIAGHRDNYTYSNIFDASRTLASLMATTPGRSLFLAATGHSVHFERPAFLAKEIVGFLPAMQAMVALPATPLSMQITCIYREQVLSVGRKKRTRPPRPGRILFVGGINQTEDVPFSLTGAECVSYIDNGSKFFVLRSDGAQTAVHVVRKGGRAPYIATVQDKSAANNLLSLPKC